MLVAVRWTQSRSRRMLPELRCDLRRRENDRDRPRLYGTSLITNGPISDPSSIELGREGGEG